MGNITLDEAVSLVKQGGWQFQPHQKVINSSDFKLLTGMDVVGDALMLVNGTTHVGSFNIADIASVDLIADPKARLITVRFHGTVKEQIKKDEGGGWRDVPRVMVWGRFVHFEAETEHQGRLRVTREQAERERKLREEQERQERFRRRAEEAQRRAEAYEQRVAWFVQRQKERLSALGYGQIDFRIEGDSVTVVFAPGFELVVKLPDDLDDGYSVPSLAIAVGGESL